MSRPLVAIPGMRSPRVEGLRREGVVVAERVAECVLRAGGEPLVVAPWDALDVRGRLAPFDAVLLPGGRDVDPARYGAHERHPRTDPPDVLQDEADLEVLRAAVELGLPTLAICRGLQLLNVAYGGTLVQHLDDEGHRDTVHRVELVAGSWVAEAMGTTAVEVSSYHHQAVDRVGAGLAVVGRAPDGCVEAVELPGAPVAAVQWHPEDDAHASPPEQGLFDALVDRARARRREVSVAS